MYQKIYIFNSYFQEYVNKARDLERELRALTIEKTRAETMLEV